MSTIVNADCGQVLGIVDGRDSAAVGGWLAGAQPGLAGPHRGGGDRPVRGVQESLTEQLPNAKISVDPFHLVQLANLMVTRVRQRLIREREQRRGRKVDPAWANRRPLLRGYDTLSPRAKARLMPYSTATTPPTSCPQPGASRNNLAAPQHRYRRAGPHREDDLGRYVVAADMEETWRLWATIEGWWPAVEVLITHRVTNARTEAANTGIKQIKRTGRDTEIRPTTKPVSCSAAPPDARREPIDQAGRHGQLRIALYADNSAFVTGCGGASHRYRRRARIGCPAVSAEGPEWSRRFQTRLGSSRRRSSRCRWV